MARSLAPYEYTRYPGGGLGPHPVCLPPPRFSSVRQWNNVRWKMRAGKRAPPAEAVPELQSCTFWGYTFPPCARWPERDQYQGVWLAPAPARGTPNVPSIPWPRFAGPSAEHVPWSRLVARPGSQPGQQPKAKRLATRRYRAKAWSQDPRLKNADAKGNAKYCGCAAALHDQRGAASATGALQGRCR